MTRRDAAFRALRTRARGSEVVLMGSRLRSAAWADSAGRLQAASYKKGTNATCVLVVCKVSGQSLAGPGA